MKQQALKFFQETNLTVLAMLLFLFAFAVILMWVFHKANRKYFEAMANLPLEDQQGDAP